jgi:hypothetical protein
MSNGTWSKDLACNWVSIHDLGDNTIRLNLVDGHCCDMDGAIMFAKKVMPEVSRIVTMSGEKRDTQYIRGANGVWQAHPA